MRCRSVVGVAVSSVLVAAACGAATAGPGMPRRLAVDPFVAVEEVPAQVMATGATVRPQHGAAAAASLRAVRESLVGVEPEPLERVGAVGTVYALPGPDGLPQDFLVYETRLMEPELAARLPGVRTYAGTGLDDPTATLRMTVTDRGLTAQVLSAHGTWYVDPAARGDSTYYVSYRRADLKSRPTAECLAEAGGGDAALMATEGGASAMGASGTTLRTYKAAIAATGEYTAFCGGVAQAQAQIVATMNRVVGIYERELSIRFTLVNNTNIVYANAGADPYTPGDLAAMLTQNQAAIDGALGNSAYNIGHVFSLTPGQRATLQNVCRTGQKAKGVSGMADPTGDPFAVAVVAHEMGHQFGAHHTFNGTGGTCGAAGERNQATSYEPGSGSTIMGYSGLCGADDLQITAGDYFHSASVDEILTYAASQACQTSAATGNGIPTVSAGGPYMVPLNTPFTLTATGSDPDNDALTFGWEERDAGGASGEALSATDTGTGPLFRSRPPVSSPSRTFPQLSDILASANVSAQEELPKVARTLNFRATARDNKAGGGAANTSDTTVQVVGTAGPFTVTYPNGGEVMSATQGVSWLVNGTSVAPINASFVNILLSTDGGQTFPITLATAVSNTGTASVVFPNISTDNARIRVEAAGKIFFDVSDADFRVRPPPAGVVLAGMGLESVSDTAPNGNGNGRIDPGESAVEVYATIINLGGATATSVVGSLESLTPTVSVVSASTTWPDLALNQSAVSDGPMVISVDPSHPCGAPISLRLHLDSAQPADPTTYDFVLSTGLPGGLSQPIITTYSGPPVPIPDRDNNVDGEVDIPFNVSGVGAMGNVEFAFLGSSCNTTLGSPTVGLDHSWPGDLVVTLISPGGQEVILAKNPGPQPLGSSGRNLCGTQFVQGGGSSIQSIVPSDAPYTASYSPYESFNKLLGKNGTGTWVLRVRDTQKVDTGSVRAFRLTLRTQTGTSCAPPGPPACVVDYNADTVVNPDDLGDYITDYFTDPPVPGPGGYAVPCPENDPPYDQGYKAAFVPGGGQCNLPFSDNLGDYITAYFTGC